MVEVDESFVRGERGFVVAVDTSAVGLDDELVAWLGPGHDVGGGPARAISDAGWSEFARMLKYKQAWRGGQLVAADRWYPSTRLCPHCGTVDSAMTLADRVFACGCGHRADRDRNAAVNLARWGHTHQTSTDPRTPKQRGRATKARRRDGADQHPRVGETSPNDAGTDVHTAPAA